MTTERDSLFEGHVYRYSRILTASVRGVGGVRLSATPGNYAEFAVNVGRLGFTFGAGMRVERERPNGSYRHTRFGVTCEFGWLNSR